MTRVFDESMVNRDDWGRFAEKDSVMYVETWVQRVSDQIERVKRRDKAGYQPGRWRQVTLDEQIATLAKDMFDGALKVQPDYDRAELRKLSVEFAEEQIPAGVRDDLKVVNGKATIISRDPRIRMSEVETLAALVDDLQTRFPTKGRIVINVVPDNYPMGHDHADAQTVHGEAFIFIKGGNWHKTKTSADGFMPAQDDNPRWLYAMAHEWGHAVDDADGLEQMMAAFSDDSYALSAYGNASPREAYAEAFAEWYLTKGRTTNKAARYYAEKFEWGEPW